MAAVTPDLGTGTTITFSSGFAAKLLDVRWSGIHREAHPTSHMGTTGGMTFIPGDLYDPGEISFDLQFDTDAAAPITGAAETVTITFPDGETWACSAFLTDFEFHDPLEEVMTATATLKCTGSITF